MPGVSVVFMYPAGVITRDIQVGPATDLSSGTPLSIRAMVTPSKALVWDGEPIISSLKTYSFAPGDSGIITLPVTNQPGWSDAKGNTIPITATEHGFYYKIVVYYLRNGSVVNKKPEMRVILPIGDGPVDADNMVRFTSESTGIAVPDTWSAQIAEAKEAAIAAALSASRAEEAVEQLDQSIDVAVTDWFDDNSAIIVSPTILEARLEAALQAHREEATPHQAYDLDMPTLKLIFENGLV